MEANIKIYHRYRKLIHVVNSSGSVWSHWSTDSNKRYTLTKGAELLGHLNELYFSPINLLYGFFSDKRSAAL
jgi:hypothetical protein